MASIIVHAGAGNFTADSERLAVAATRRAAVEGWKALRRGAPAIEAIVAAIRVLEDDPSCNAGLGSNLTRQGTVECDASVMDGASGAWGGCGATGDVSNPVALAHNLLAGQLNGAGPAGIVPPMLLVGRGAHERAVAHGLTTVAPAGGADEVEISGLITGEARAKWRRYSAWLHAAEEKNPGFQDQRNVGTTEEGMGTTAPIRRKRSASEAAASDAGDEMADGDAACSDGAGWDDSPTLRDRSGVQDTVGAVAIDETGHVAAGVSSGGAWLKSEGRIGEAAIYGAGCWAEESFERPASGAWGAGASVSGVGEQVRPATTGVGMPAV